MAEGDKERLWARNTAVSDYHETTLMEPFVGYFVYNDSSDTQLLFVPCAELGPQFVPAQPADAYTSEEWEVNFTVFSGDVADLVNTIGAASGASDELDRFDYSQPPPFGTYVSLSFVVVNKGGKKRLLAGDFRSPTEDNWRFDLLLQGNTGRTAQLAVGALSSVAQELELVLVDETASIMYDLQQEPVITLPRKPTPQGARFSLLVGKGALEDAQEMVVLLQPESFSLHWNYPNPFNPTTEISFDLPIPSGVRLEVFNLLGQRVSTLVNEFREAGTHSVTWNGMNTRGMTVSSGIYFYRLEAGGFIVTKKMMLLK